MSGPGPTEHQIDFEKVFAGLPAMVVLLDRQFRYLELNRGFELATNVRREDAIGRAVFEVFPETPERQSVFRAAWEDALEGRETTVERQPYEVPDGEGGMRDAWWTVRARPMRDSDGQVCGIVQFVTDVTDVVRAEQMRDVVLRELDHRMKNQLATVSAIARRTARDAPDTDEFLSSFDRRIGAMSRTHQMLVDGQWGGLSLGDLVVSELSPYREGVDDRIVVEGPPVTLSPAEAQTMGLALHELSTNAAKYGALSAAGEALSVTWSDKKDRVRLDWRERARQVARPSRTGFGSVIVEQLLPRQIGAVVERDYHADGMHCSIEIPR